MATEICFVRWHMHECADVCDVCAACGCGRCLAWLEITADE
jgi:hypothetical protein